MATQIASMPPSVAVLPFLFARPQLYNADWNYRAALFAATSAERADDTRRNTRGRVAYLLCEFGYQLGRRRIDADRSLPLTRRDISDALDVSLCRVKRTLALLSLSQAIECDAATMRVLDWARLCSVATYEASRLELKQEEDELDLVSAAEDEEQPLLVTRAGDPACFV